MSFRLFLFYALLFLSEDFEIEVISKKEVSHKHLQVIHVTGEVLLQMKGWPIWGFIGQFCP